MSEPTGTDTPGVSADTAPLCLPQSWPNDPSVFSVVVYEENEQARLLAELEQARFEARKKTRLHAAAEDENKRLRRERDEAREEAGRLREERADILNATRNAMKAAGLTLSGDTRTRELHKYCFYVLNRLLSAETGEGGEGK